MKITPFQRNYRASDQLELFLVSAVTSLLAVRAYLHLSGYPQIGTDGLHIAHMLWGGFLMTAAIAMVLTYIGSRIERIAAIIGGIGFGVFIDELGKFITRDNDYFFQPAIALIYAIFMVLFLIFRSISSRRSLSVREYRLNALVQLEEAVLHDMDATEQQRVRELLKQSDPNDPVTRQLTLLVNEITPVSKDRESVSSRISSVMHRFYRRWAYRKWVTDAVRIIFLAEAGLFLLATAGLTIATAAEAFRPDSIYSAPFLISIGQLVSSMVAIVFILIGVFLYRRSRLRAYEMLMRATLINIFLTDFFIFYRQEFAALPEFAFHFLTFLALRYAIREEQLNQSDSADS